MHRISSFYLLFLVALFSLSCFAQDSELKVTHIADEDGLPLGFTQQVVFDSSGFAWISGWDQIVRFDGYNVDRYSTIGKEELRLTGRTEVLLSMDKMLWIMDHEKVIKFDPYRDQVLSQHDTKELFQSYAAQNSKIKETTDGKLWIISNFSHNKDDNNICYLGLLENKVLSLVSHFSSSFNTGPSVEIFENKLSLIHEDGIIFLKEDGSLDYEVLFESKKIDIPYSYMDETGNLWIKSHGVRYPENNQIFYLPKGKSEFLQYHFKTTVNLKKTLDFIILDSIFWLGGINGEIIKVDENSRKVTRFLPEISTLNNFPIVGCEAVDFIPSSSGDIWLTTTNGLLKIKEELPISKSYLSTKDENCLFDFCSSRGITEDEAGNIYMSYYDNVSVLNKETGAMNLLFDQKPDKIPGAYSLEYSNGKLYWVDLEIDLATKASRVLIPNKINGHVTSCFDDRNVLWMFSWQPLGLYQYYPESQDLLNLRLPEGLNLADTDANEMRWNTSRNSMWMATSSSGLLELDERGNLKNHFSTDFSSDIRLKSNNVKALHFESDGILWIGHSAGLSKINLKSKSIKHYQISSSESYEVVGILAGSNGDLWLSTNLGLYQFLKDSELFLTFPENYEVSKKEFNRSSSFRSSDGKLLFGSLNGVHELDLTRLTDLQEELSNRSIIITEYSYFDKKKNTQRGFKQPALTSNGIVLGPYDQNLMVEFAYPYYRSESSPRYSYWLEGFSQSWSEPRKSNEVLFEKIPPGEYQLHLRVGGYEIGLAPHFKTISVEVLKEWYNCWWAYILYAIGLFLLGYAIYKSSLKRQFIRQEGIRLKEMDQFKTDLFTNITHEFRTPLTVILGMADNLKEKSDERVLIKRNSEHLLRLINQILDLSKLEAGSMTLDLVKGDIINYCKYLTESFQSLASEREVNLVFYPEVETLQMSFDESKIQHIIYNLVSNALKFTPPGGQIVVNLRKINENEDEFLLLKVSDTGPGIAKEDHEHIFKRFFQSSLTKSENVDNQASTGIGLALVKEVVELMSGEISVISEPPNGAHFNVKIPIALLDSGAGVPIKEDTLIITSVSSKSSLSDIPTEILNDESDHILLVEDNRDVASYIQSLIKGKYAFSWAKDGKEGIERAIELIPNIIISDVMMPHVSGYELCEALKKDDRTSHIPIILLTAKAGQVDRLSGLEFGADAYLTKPFDRKELFIRLDKLIEKNNLLKQKYSSAEAFSEIVNDKVEQHAQDPFLLKVSEAIHKIGLDSPELLSLISQDLGLSKTQFYRKIKAITSETPTILIRRFRLHEAKKLLSEGKYNVSEVAYDTGFADPSYFSRVFKEEFGENPSDIIRD